MRSDLEGGDVANTVRRRVFWQTDASFSKNLDRPAITFHESVFFL
jgi:hypothetical protein